MKKINKRNWFFGLGGAAVLIIFILLASSFGYLVEYKKCLNDYQSVNNVKFECLGYVVETMKCERQGKFWREDPYLLCLGGGICAQCFETAEAVHPSFDIK